MAKRFPSNPAHPERNCWGCDKYCAVDALACGNGSERTQHPAELFGADWETWEPPAEGMHGESLAGPIEDPTTCISATAALPKEGVEVT
jgi:hypothetical protein